MCGIAGFAGFAPLGADTTGVVKKMTNALVSRGPDAVGTWLHPGAQVALGHRRLSIIELSAAGAQPMVSADGMCTIAFNGEIYNHKELRRELAAGSGGVRWRGNSDTETLLEGICAWGIENTLKKAAGMFAFALWDSKINRLFLVRDRFGEKPLYYFRNESSAGTAFVFGSEIKALRAHPLFRSVVNREALRHYCRTGVTSGSESIIEGVSQIPPATIGVVDPRRPSEVVFKKYWDFVDVLVPERGVSLESTDDIVSGLEDLLVRVIGEQMEVDVPYGAFLSGGIDSSTVVALMQKIATRPVKTFSVGFGDEMYDEASHARAVAAQLGTEHTELLVGESDLLGVVPLLPRLYDEPFADSSAIPTYIVSRLARNHVAVALTGDGGDEVFGGYNRHVFAKAYYRKLERIPYVLRAVAGRTLMSVSSRSLERLSVRGWLPAAVSTALGRSTRIAETMRARSLIDLYGKLTSQWGDDLVLGGGRYAVPAEDRLLKTVFDLSHLQVEEKIMAADALTYLPDDILTKVDRASMGVSLETRVPFLDHRVAEFAWRLPSSMKIRRESGAWTSKWALRQVLYRHVPRGLVDRPKMGFGIPLGSWLRGGLRDWAESLLSPSRLRSDGYFDDKLVSRYWLEHLSGRRNWEHQLWIVLIFQIWLDHMGEIRQ